MGENKSHVNCNKQIYYAIFFFAYLILYNYIVINRFQMWKVDEITYTYHLVDFSFGFVTKVLPGAIYHLFFHDVIPAQVTVYETGFLLIIFLLVSLLLSKVVSELENKKNRNYLLGLSLFFLSGPATFSIFSFELGMLDVYWLFLSALFIFAVQNKYLKYLTPALFVLTLLIHFSSILAYVPFFLFLLFYQIDQCEKSERKKYIAITIVSVLVVAGTFAYFLKNEQSNLVYSVEEFNQEIERRTKSDDEPYLTYYDYSLYSEFALYPDEVDHGVTFKECEVFAASIVEPLLLPMFLARPIVLVIRQIYLNVFIYKEAPYLLIEFAAMAFITMPLCGFFYKVLKKKIKESKSKYRKVVLCIPMLMFPVTVSFSLLFSPDISRWFTHGFLSLFSIFWYVLYRERDDVYFLFENGQSKVCYFEYVFYFLMYALTFFQPYV